LYLAILTLGLVFIGEHIFKEAKPITGGAGVGRAPAEPVFLGFNLFANYEVFGIEIDRYTMLFFTCLVIFVVMALLARNFTRSRFGRSFAAVRDRDIAAEVMGVSLLRTKTLAFAISAFYAGIAGALFSIVIGRISPETWNFFLSVDFLAVIFIGGLATITGSIGVLGMIPNLEQTMKNKLGITFDYVQTNENANIFSANRPLTPFQKGIIQEYIEDVYDTFITHVAEGREMTKEEVDAIGQGRVWVGTDAKQNELVDEFGGLQATIDAIAEAAELETYSIKELPEQKDFFEELMKELTGQARLESKIKQELGENYQLYQYLKYWQNASGVQARMPFNIHIN